MRIRIYKPRSNGTRLVQGEVTLGHTNYRMGRYVPNEKAAIKTAVLEVHKHCREAAGQKVLRRVGQNKEDSANGD